MKTTWAFASLLTLAAATAVALAQPPDDGPAGDRPPRGEGPPHGPPPPPPVIAALDADRDGTLSAEEISKASEALQSLDKNEDGKLDEDELRPPRPPRGDRPGWGAFGPPPRQGAGPPERRQGRRDRAPRGDEDGPREHRRPRGPEGRGGPSGPPPGPPEGQAGLPPLVPPHLRDALDLSAEQTQKLAALHEEVQGKLGEILTDQQREKLARFRPPHPPGPPVGPRGPRPPRED